MHWVAVSDVQGRTIHLIVFFLLGAAAGIVNVMRVASGYGLAAGYKKPGDEGAKDKD